MRWSALIGVDIPANLHDDRGSSEAKSKERCFHSGISRFGMIG
jgi:hypothetical protein